VIAADDGSAEFRLAAALASQYGRDLRSVRRHCVPRSPRRSARYGGRFYITARGAYGGRDLIWTGLDPIADLCALAWRRLVRSRTGNLGGFELRGRLAARLGDINAFLSGAVDDARLAALARGLMAVRWRERGARDLPLRGAALPEGAPWPVYAPFRLLYLPAPRTGGDSVEARPGAVDPAPLRLLMDGHLARAVRLALRRLGLPWLRAPHIADALAGAPMDAPRLARRVAASLCFPIRTEGERSDIARLRRALLPLEES
jgi:CRISPR-associated protein Csx17